MNIKISKKEAQKLLERKLYRYVIGSHLYGTATEYSDTDILIVYESFNNEIDHIFQSRHQFQWDDEENDIDYIFTTKNQFWMNLWSGESTINADCVMFEFPYLKNEEKLVICRTFNVIKSFIGYAKRDIKLLNKKNKYFHSVRGLYTAGCLLENRLPKIEEIQEIKHDKYSKTKQELQIWHDELRLKCNIQYQEDKLTMYPEANKLYNEEDNIDPLHMKLINSCNIKEFRYE